MAIEIWQVDLTRSEIKFTLRHLFLAAISGRVRRWKGTLRIDAEKPTCSSVEVVIDARSLDTDEPERDEHIRSAEFLNTDVYSEIRFSSTTVVAEGSARYLVKGNLTIGAVTREVTLEVSELERLTGGDGAIRATFRGHGTFDRQAFGLHWNQDLDKGGIVVGDKVDINVSLEGVRTVTSDSGQLREEKGRGMTPAL